MQATATAPKEWRSRVRTLAAELLTGLGSPRTGPERLRLAAWVRLLVGLPIIIAPTGHALVANLPGSWAPEASRTNAYVWFAHVAVFLAANLASLALRGVAEGTSRHRTLWRLSLLSLLTEVGMNQASIYASGSMTNIAVINPIMLVAVYRVFFDHRMALVAFLYGLAAFTTVALVEAAGALPPAPLSPAPFVHPLFQDPDVAVAVLTTFAGALLLTFMAVNYGVNQTIKLHRYVTHVVLGRYLPPALVAKASRGELSMDEPPERRVVTVSFTDLVGFTQLSERLGAQAVGVVLDRYLAEVVEIAHRHGATIDKFVGDAVMLVFGAPEPLPPAEQARRAVLVAHEVHALVRDARLGVALAARTGINTGEVVVGHFGSDRRSDYTVIGPVVNVAARLESASRPGQVLVGAETARLLPPAWRRLDAGQLTLKGVSEPVQAYFIEVPDASPPATADAA